MDGIASSSRCETSSSQSRSSRVAPSHAILRSEFESLISESSSDEEESSSWKIDQPRRSKNQDATEKANPMNPSLPNAQLFDDADETILSLIWSKNRLAAAYYSIVTSELFVMEDTTDDAERFDVMKALYRQCRPRHVVVIAGTAVPFMNALNKLVATETLREQWDSSGANRLGRNAVIRIMCKKEHNFDRSLHRVRCLRLESEPNDSSNADRLIFLNSLLNFKCCAMIYALGSLLLFIDKHWNNIALDRSGRPSFVSLEYIVLQDLVMVDEDTYAALNIVQARDHPSSFKFGKTVTKSRGVSLFSLLNRYCQSRPGVHFLWKTLQHPTRNIPVLKQRFDTIEFFLDPNNQSIVENLSSCLRYVDRLTTTILVCCSGPQAKASNWYKLYKTISHVICIADICENYAERNELFKQITESITSEMQYAKYFIDYIVDFGRSRREGKITVKPNVDPLLDELNHVRYTLPELLTRMGEKDMREHLPPSVTGCNMLYLPNIGYVLAINNWNPTPPEDAAFPSLEFKFTINNVHYFKSPSARELDQTVGDIILKIAVRENHIIQKLIRYVRKHAGPVLRTIRLCGELDALLAFYKVTRDYNYVRPNVTESKIIDVKEGRHPLLECLTTFVPNDIHSGNGKSLMKVLTGPNSCGKSVYLKQIGLIVFMAHIGCYVPAKSATIGAVTHILTQMVNTESVGLDASSFLQNLRQINVALRASTPHSLLITDELDRGTSEISGSSLVAAVLNTFAERGTECPHVFAATHAHTALSLLARTPIIEVQTFEYVVNEDESLAFLHRLTNGSTTRSFAHSVARSAELDENIIHRSLEVYEAIGRDDLPSNTYGRTDAVKRVVELATATAVTDIDLDELQRSVREAVVPRLPSNI